MFKFIHRPIGKSDCPGLMFHRCNRKIEMPIKSIKDAPRGTANCEVLGDGSKPEHHSHVRKSSPMTLKRREIMNDPRYRTELSSDTIDKPRESRTTAKRRDKEIRPL